MNQWLPISVVELRHYSKKQFVSDAIAGISVGLVALPLSLAIAIASGLPPQAGLHCAIVAGFLASALGGSLTQMSGPAGAFVMLVYGIVAKQGIDGLFLCTLMAGAILIVLGVTGLGAAVKFIPRPVIVGFTNGIAILLASTQINYFFGIKITNAPGEFWARVEMLAKNFRTFSGIETILSVVALTVIFIFMRYVKRVSGYIVALFVGTALAMVLKLPVETIATRFGGIPSGLVISIPHFHFSLLPSLVSPAIAVAVLGAILSLASPVVSEGMRGSKHGCDLELIGQGVANVFSAFFGGLPATGAIAQTTANIRAGAKTPVAGMLQALLLLVFVLFAAPFTRFIPLSVLAAITLAAAYRMGEWNEIPQLLKLSRLEIGVWLTTFLLTVFADLTTAVEVGMILAVLVFIRNVTTGPAVALLREEYVSKGHALQ